VFLDMCRDVCRDVFLGLFLGVFLGLLQHRSLLGIQLPWLHTRFTRASRGHEMRVRNIPESHAAQAALR
jgi:hypothetical protein